MKVGEGDLVNYSLEETQSFWWYTDQTQREFPHLHKNRVAGGERKSEQDDRKRGKRKKNLKDIINYF